LQFAGGQKTLRWGTEEYAWQDAGGRAKKERSMTRMTTTRFFVPALLLLVLGVAGCSSKAPAPPPTGAFSDASLKGQYAFSMSGVEGGTGAYIARIGSFTADGAGNITAGVEDVLNLSSGQPASVVPFTGGSYTIESNGRGTAMLNITGGVLQISIAMQSPTQAYVIETDLTAATSGSAHLQTSSDFSASALNAQYAFELSGTTFLPSTPAPISFIGEFDVNGSGGIAGGVMDTDNGNLTPTGPVGIAASSYAMDPTNGPAFGRGTMTFSGYTFAFYIVDSTHIVMMEEDSLGGVSGDAFLQSGPVPTQNSEFSGSFVYLVSGYSVAANTTKGPLARVARFTADGNGGLNSITLDNNYNGQYSHASQGTSATYSIDTTNAGSGRGTFTYLTNGFTLTYVFYVISSSQALVQETSSSVIAAGPMDAQSAGPFALSGLTGNFIFNWNGEQLGATTAIPLQENFVGQYALSSSGNSNIAGATDYVTLGLSGNDLNSDAPLAGTLTINGDGTANNHYQFGVNASTSTTINFQAYFVNPSTVFLVTSDSNRNITGIIIGQ
jgi:hypothetical protein